MLGFCTVSNHDESAELQERSLPTTKRLCKKPRWVMLVENPTP